MLDIHGLLLRLQRGARAVERAGLENRNTRKCIVGSNPTLPPVDFTAALGELHHRVFVCTTVFNTRRTSAEFSPCLEYK